MNAAVFGLALVMIVVGGATLLGGVAIIGNERGWTQVIAGTTVLTGGCIVFALGCVVVALGRLRSQSPGSDSSAAVPTVAPPVPRAELEGALARTPAAAPASGETEDATHEPEPASDRRLAATYSAAGIGYFMYSDGTIEAEMEVGRYRFTDMDALRRFIETGQGGVKVEAPPPPGS